MALAILAGVGLAYQTVWPADPGDDEIAQVLMPAEGDTPAVRQFKDTGKNPYNKEPHAIEQGFKLARAVACTHCHAGDLSGLIGPNLITGNWRYPKDGTDKGMFQTLYFGTGAGMAGRIVGGFVPVHSSRLQVRMDPAHRGSHGPLIRFVRFV